MYRFLFDSNEMEENKLMRLRTTVQLKRGPKDDSENFEGTLNSKAFKD